MASARLFHCVSSGSDARMGISTCFTPWADSFDMTTLAVSWAASLTWSEAWLKHLMRVGMKVMT